MTFIMSMIINKLASGVKMPYNVVKGSFAQRQSKSGNLADLLYKNVQNHLIDDYSKIDYLSLQKYIQNILPDKGVKIIVQNLAENKLDECEGACEVLYNVQKEIRAISINLGGIGNMVKSVHIPAFIHEFQHVCDDIYHPKFLARLQSLNKKNLANKKYDDFYDQYYYCTEFVEFKRDKKDFLKIIKNKTKKFLKGFNIEDKMDYIQDMRYSLMSEIEAYKKGRAAALDLKSQGFMVKDGDLEDYPKDGLFAEKINLLKELGLEYITKERSKNLGRLNKSNSRKKANSKI